MAKYRFEIVSGTYVGKDAKGQSVKHEPKTKTRYIDTDQNLAKRFGAEQFKLLSGGGTIEDEEGPATTGEGAAGGEEERDELTRAELEKLTVPELKDMAAEHEVDLAGADRKADIIDRLLGE